MTYYSTLTSDTSLFSPPRPMDKYPKESFQKMAVLFTDIVGSTAYFKSYGNLAGREMLQTHQNLAAGPISQHNGFLVKTLGDSVMAYFVDPREALKAAIKIQHGFKSYNEGKADEGSIHIRVGIDFGEGIIEEKDIFGDVVNTAAKLVQATESDEIYISQGLYDAVKDLSHGIFQLADISSKAKVLKEVPAYKVLWRQATALELTRDTLLYLKPLLKPGKKDMEGVWSRLIELKEEFWGGSVKAESILFDKSVALILKEAPLAIDIAKAILAFLKENLGKDYEYFPVPVKIIIDSGAYLGAGKLNLETLKADWDEIDPGEAYITASAYTIISTKYSFSTTPSPEAEPSRPFYKIILDEDHAKRESLLFMYQKALVQGENSPCFYCGNRGHTALHCPSKNLTETTGSLEKLGYLSLDKINRLFYYYLSGVDLDDCKEWPAIEIEPGSWRSLAYHGFYELKSVCQLCFFKNIWDSTIEDWEEVKKSRIKRPRGGPVWLGQDCIRVSDLAQAENILQTCIGKNPGDYKAYCAMGFVKMEKDNFAEARIFFDKAMSYAKTKPQKILTLFLLSRLYDLNMDTEKAERMISEILFLLPECPEAIYQDTIFKFRRGFVKEALRKLSGLIEKKHEYYISALIDPELEPFADIVHPELQRLFVETKTKASEIVPEAGERAEKLKMILSKKDGETGKVESMMSTIETLFKVDSYRGYVEIDRYAQSIISITERSATEKRKKISEMLFEIDHRCKDYIVFTESYPYKGLVRSSYEKLKTIRSKARKIKALAESPEISDELNNAFIQVEDLFLHLDKIKPTLKWLKNIGKACCFLTALLKKSLMLQFFNLIIGLMLLPVVMHYLILIIPNMSSHINIWLYQKGFLVVGGISGLFLALLMATRELQTK